MWDLIVSVPDLCLSFYFEISRVKYDHYTIFNASRSTFQVSSRCSQRV